jgi:Cellulase (glycosyl hydrolase family 5)
MHQITQKGIASCGRLVAITFVAILAQFPAFAEFESPPSGPNTRWSEDRANVWYARQPWLIGANFVPSTAINQLEMWQADTFDPKTIDRELGWAAEIGMNTMRVFLHDIPWREDADGFYRRIDQYLEIAHRHRIRTMFVLFDGVWNPLPKSGQQPRPTPHVHNSGWVQSPGKVILGNPALHAELKGYVQGVLSRFQNDERVLAWDLFNEPDNANTGKWEGTPNEDLPPRIKHDRACELLEKAFAWAREVNPSQPLTAGVWGDPQWLKSPSRIEDISLQKSDVISFHTYHNAQDALPILNDLDATFNRPILCTEYMARGNGSTFEELLPLLRERRIAAYNWGLVNGKSQTIYPWDSWYKSYSGEPELWFHDVFRGGGKPYRDHEVQIIKSLATSNSGSSPRDIRSESTMTNSEIKPMLKSHNRPFYNKAGRLREPGRVLGAHGILYSWAPLRCAMIPGSRPIPMQVSWRKRTLSVGGCWRNRIPTSFNVGRSTRLESIHWSTSSQLLCN